MFASAERRTEIDAIRVERFWILTHPQWKSMIRHRMDNVVEERDPTPAGPPPTRGS